MKTGVILQCRSQSKRLPRKIYMDLNGSNSIQRILSGLKKTIVPHKIILAMPAEDKAEIEQRIRCGELNDYIDDRFELFIGDGDQNDLVDRYHKAMQKFGIDICARITGDCPMWCGASSLMDEMLMEYMKLGGKGFMGNNLLVAQNSFSCGLDCEIFGYQEICWTKMHAKTSLELEHCVPLMYSDISPFPILPFNNNRPHTMISTRISDFSLDTASDYQLLLRLTACYDKYQDINKAIENVDLTGFDKTNMSKNFRQ